MKNWFILMRPKHWIKNCFCLAALIFSGQWISIELWVHMGFVLVGFCLLSSGSYLINDAVNIKEDAHHPRKSHRPLAAGRLKRAHVVIVGIHLALLGLGIMVWKYVGMQGWVKWTPAVGGAYFLLTTCYTFYFRRYPVLDVMVIGLGFLSRVVAGAFALNLVPTLWLLSCTYFMVLLIGFGKRLGELSTMGHEKKVIGNTRMALMGYTSCFLDKLILGCAIASVMLYIAYCFSRDDSIPFIFSAVPVVTGIALYLNQFKRSGRERAESPETLVFKEPFLLGSVVLWVSLVVILPKL